MRFDAMLDGKFIVSDEIQVNIEGELLETADQVAAPGKVEAETRR